MGINKKFYTLHKIFNVGQLCNHLKAELDGDSSVEICDFASADRCEKETLTFVNKASFNDEWRPRGVVITTASYRERFPSAQALLVVKNPRVSFAKAINWSVSALQDHTRLINNKNSISGTTISPTSVIHQGVVIGDGVVLGNNSVVCANTVVGNGVRIGDDCYIGPNCSLEFCEIGRDCHIEAGCVLGGTGFGFEMTNDGPEMIPQIGTLQIGQGVHIGSNSAIDRGSLGDTVIGDHVMIDNLVHIAHNCSIGDRCVISGQVGIAGSSILDSGVVIGGQAGVSDHLNIGAEAVIFARSGVTKNVPAGSKVAGFPAVEAGKHWREQAAMRQILRQRMSLGKNTPPKD